MWCTRLIWHHSMTNIWNSSCNKALIIICKFIWDLGETWKKPGIVSHVIRFNWLIKRLIKPFLDQIFAPKIHFLSHTFFQRLKLNLIMIPFSPKTVLVRWRVIESLYNRQQHYNKRNLNNVFERTIMYFFLQWNTFYKKIYKNEINLFFLIINSLQIHSKLSWVK